MFVSMRPKPSTTSVLRSVGLGFFEVRQHLVERPPLAAALRPLIVFSRMAAQIEHAVDAARAAENAALKPRQTAAV
jgi:hypothetical protein